MSSIGLLIGAFPLLVGLLIARVGYVQYVQERQRYVRSASTFGTITTIDRVVTSGGVSAEGSTSASGHSHRVTVRFRTADGRDHEGTDVFGFGLPDGVEVGASVPVRYDPTAPDTVVLDVRKVTAGNSLAVMLVGLTIAVIGIGVAVLV